MKTGSLLMEYLSMARYLVHGLMMRRFRIKDVIPFFGTLSPSSTELNSTPDGPCFVAIILSVRYAPYVLLSESVIVGYRGLVPTS